MTPSDHPLTAVFHELAMLPEHRETFLDGSSLEAHFVRTVRLLARRAEAGRDHVWTPVVERRPRSQDANANGQVLVYQLAAENEYMDAMRYDRIFSGISHWRKMPAPPCATAARKAE